MSATPNNAGAGWNAAPAETARRVAASHPGNGQNALQALLAFACIHEQAEKRRRAEIPADPSDPGQILSRDEQFALDEVLHLVAERAIVITGADGIAIALANEKAIVCRASSGKIAPDTGATLDPNSGFSGACLRSGETVRCDDSETDSRVDAKACRALGARSMVAVPLSAKQRVVGLVEAFSTESFGFNDSDVRSLNLLSELILAAIRPEEEDRLAALAQRVLPAIVPSESGPAEQQTIAEQGAKPPAREAATEAAKEAPAANASEPAAGGKSPEMVADIAAATPAPSPVLSAGTAKVLVDERFTPTVIPAAIAKIHAVEAAPAEPPRKGPPAAALPTPHEAAPLFLAQENQPSKHSVISIVTTAAAVLIAIALLGALIWKGHRVGQAMSANSQTTAEAKIPESQPAQTAPPALLPVKPGALPLVSGLQHFSKDDSSTVVVDLQDQVQYEEHSIDDPPRIYFDLHDTKLTPELANRTVDINDSFIKRVRIAQPVEGVTRVVLETKNNPGFSVSLDSDPYRLVIEVHKATTTPATPQPTLQPGTQTKPSPAIGTSPKKTSAAESQTPRGSFVIVLDPGHGGWDLGTVGRKGLLEKDLVLDIVKRLGILLETKLGAEVIYTRQDDTYVPLEKRAEIANLAKADLFLSVHANYSDISTARGVETYYTTTYSSVKARTAEVPSLQQVNWSGVVDIRAKVKDSHRLASDIQQALYGGLITRNPETRNRGVKQAEYVVLSGTQMPAALAEVSFVSSPSDEDKLQSSEYRQSIAEALYRGIARYHKDAVQMSAKNQFRSAARHGAVSGSHSQSSGASD
jgi:N-acetylmuramoyl-L-alanine amidase